MKQKRKTRRKRQNLTAICVTLAMIMSLFVGIPFTPITAHAAESKNIGIDVVYAAGDTIVLPDGGSYFKFDNYSNAEQKSGNSTVNNISSQYGDHYYIDTRGDWSSYFSLDGYGYSEYTRQGLVVIGIKFSGSGTSEDPYIPLLAYGELDAVWEGDGEGTESSPYLINNVNDLKTLADNVKSGMLYGGKYFKLTSDIDCGEENWEPIGGTNQFRGTFDGDGNTVTYHITDNSENGSKGLGLFYGIAVSGTVKNLKVSGSIVGTSIYGNYYAGIAGINRGTIINCSSNVNITSPGTCIAGIAGTNNGTISYCAASGSITWNGGSNSYAYVAGMTGMNDGTVTNCTSLCDISAVNANGYSYASRVIGRNFGTVQNCYYLSSATITGDYVGTNDATEKTTDELKEIGEAAYNAGYNVYGLALGYMSAPTIKTQPEDIELTYGYTEGSVSVEATTEKGLTLSYQWYSNSTNTTEGGTAIIDADNASYVIPVGKDVGTEEYYYCVVTASSMNASITTTSDIAKVTVKKADASVEVAPEAKTLTYTGSAQELVTAGSTNDGKIYYTVTTENKAPTDESLYSTDIPTATNAGTYYVWYKVVGDTNHNDTTSSKVEVNIKQADVKVTAPTAINSTYNGKEQALVNAGVTEDGKVFYRLGTDGTWTNTVPTAKNVGEYEVYYYVDGDDNHSDSGSAEEPLGSVKVTIAKKTVTVSGITAEGKEYDGNTGATISTENATLAGLVDGDTLTVAAKGTFSDANAGNGKKVNITDITLGGTSVDNYVLAEEGQQKEATANITPKAVTVIPDAGQSKVYGAADPAFKYTAEGIVGEEKLSGALERTAGDSVGEYAYTIGTLDSANANYNVSIAENAPKFEIKKTDQSKPEGLEIENVSAENATDGSITGVTDNMEYSTDDGKTWNAVPANADKIEGLAVGEVLVRYAGSDDKNASAEVMLTIGVASKTEGVVEFKPEEGGTTVAEKAITGVDNESTKASVEDFAETQQEEGKDVKVALEITPQKEENVNKESVEETNKVVEEVFVGIDREKVVTEYLAIDVAKYVDNGKETENISDTKTPLEIALRFDGKKTNPIVVRTHDGKAKAFGKLKARPAKKDYKDAMFYIDVENAILYIYSQYFSDFAIVYANEVTYNVGFVSGTSENLSPLVVAEGGKVTLPTGLKNEGYAFDGWYKDEAYTTAWKENDTVNEDITLYAKWNKSVTGVSVATPEERFTKAGETSDIKVTVTPEDAANTRVTYKSSDTKVATVDANGKITAVANGTATITITTEDGAKTATVKVTVAIPDVKQQGTTEQSKTTEQPVQQPTKEEKAVISMNAGLKVSQTGSKINIKWGKVKEADGYDVYVAYCGKKFGKAVKTINKNSTTSITVKKINSKKINFKKNFKVYVAAYKMVDGKKEVLAKSIMGHVVGCKNTKYSNAKKITIAKSNYSISVGKTAKIKAKTVLVQKGKKQLTDAHAKEFRYASSNKNIATVDQNGKIKGVAKGICTIYVYARNGYAKTVKITVK